MITYLLLSIVLGLVTVHLFTRFNKIRRTKNKIPGPLAWPFIGNYWKLWGSAEHVWYALHKTMDQYYPVSKLWYLGYTMVLIRHPDDLEILLSSKLHLEKGTMYELMKPLFQDGVLTSKGEKWLKQRKLITSSLNLENLKKYVDVTNHCVNEMIENIKSYGRVSDQKVSTMFYAPLIYTFCEALLDVDVRKLSNDLVDNYIEGINDFLAVFIHRSVRPYIMNWMMPFLGVGKKLKKASQNFSKLRDEVIKHRKQFHEETGYRYLKETVDIDDETSGGRKRKLSLLDLLLLAEREGRIDENGVNDEVDTMLMTGHDTVATAMIYVVMLLAENKKAQELARKEVNEVFEKANGQITLAEVQKLEYLDLCVKEALRLYPSAGFFFRRLREDLHLKNYTVPAGVDVLCMTNSLHRDPQFWPNPDKFDPDRFAPHLVEKRHPYAYLPFSGGIRNCLGRKFAVIQVKIITAKILYNFYLEPIDLTKDLRFNATISLHQIKPLYTKFIAINK